MRKPPITPPTHLWARTRSSWFHVAESNLWCPPLRLTLLLTRISQISRRQQRTFLFNLIFTVIRFPFTVHGPLIFLHDSQLINKRPWKCSGYIIDPAHTLILSTFSHIRGVLMHSTELHLVHCSFTALAAAVIIRCSALNAVSFVFRTNILQIPPRFFSLSLIVWKRAPGISIPVGSIYRSPLSRRFLLGFKLSTFW